MQSIGTPFDADIHEAITNIPAPTDDMKGKVVDEMEKGYYLNDKVIRFAKVIVGSLINFNDSGCSISNLLNSDFKP
jgi:molecular chaperone GrpE